ncbi:MAG: DUF5131 family protein [Bacteroidota bacterium]
MENSKIQWTDATWNPWHGCTKVSAGCKNCYMYRDKAKYGQDGSTVQRSKTQFTAPLKWKKPQLIFTCSWSDFFEPQADEWRAEAWEIIKQTPQHTYQILTKRPERIKKCLPKDWIVETESRDRPLELNYPNVWLGVSVENQQTAEERIPILNAVPAICRFISFEPLLEMIHLSRELSNFRPWDWDLIHWIIIGGESGNDSGIHRYRRCRNSWIKVMAYPFLKNQIPVFIKQLGTHLAKELSLKDRSGGNPDEWPANYLRFRQIPYHLIHDHRLQERYKKLKDAQNR